VFVGISLRDPWENEGLARVAARAHATLAHLQLREPSLGRELTRLAEDGVDAIQLVGFAVGEPNPGLSWLRRVAGHWWRACPEPRPQIEVSPLLVRKELQVESALSSFRPITGQEPGLRSAAWEDVPGHRHHLFICRGPRCTAIGADASATSFTFAMLDHGLDDDDVLVTHTACQFPCNQAPVVNVQPDDVWYGHVDPEVARNIVEQHLVHDRPLADNRLARRRAAPRRREFDD
jgi:(2Fe-2S) ferredoxin